jgi:hypothetical protein
MISVGSSVMQSSDGKSWGPTYPPSNKTFGLLTPYPPPEAPPGNFPLHDFGNTQGKYQGQKTAFKVFGGSKPTFYSIDGRGRFSAVTQDTLNLTFTGLPREMGCIQTTCCNCPFRADSGNMARLHDTTLVLAMNVFYQPSPGLKGDGSSVVLYSSQGGLDWKFKSNIAVAEDFPWSGEGPNEATVSLLANEKTLICIFRVDAGDGGKGGKPYMKTFSHDDGATWSAPQNMSAGVGTAKPRLILLDRTKGPLILVGGRPGNKVWVNPDGFGGDEWYEQDMPSPPPCSKCTSTQKLSTSYNGIALLTPTTGAVSFDYNNHIYTASFSVVQPDDNYRNGTAQKENLR